MSNIFQKAKFDWNYSIKSNIGYFIIQTKLIAIKNMNQIQRKQFLTHKYFQIDTESIVSVINSSFVLVQKLE